MADCYDLTQEKRMSLLRRLLRNLRAFVLFGPRAWWLARQSVVRYGAIQHIDELAEFAKMLCVRSPKTVLEIGTAQGGLFWLFCRVCAADAMLVSLDLPPEGRYSGGQRISIDLESMKRPGQTVHVIHGNSHDAGTYERVREAMGGKTLDLLFIDGDHTYAGVRQDYDLYRHLVRPGGLIAFHDIVQTPWPDCEVDRFWKELAGDQSLQPKAILSQAPSDFGGIGVVTSA
jgi:predicted O-methyltransferase YrrM